ncbi:two-component system response regulator BtsR [Roseicella aquatilis]|uniref:Two-component system response regulator BtsR n=1 Tax=Roseicella aquatilis TaxID=2527868 RepID=A0A4V6P638_9PROT|nr:two-component system response regulator BtsR [Roseicella aquatilis]TCZ64855.1 two-component system response regulator BtsR [Roseicella aquatilis]
MMRVLIVDDEPLARQELRILLAEAPDVQVIGECGNAIEAIGAINREAPDVVFLDIQMPRVSGLEMLSMLDPERMPRVVFLTAHDEYAVQAFEGSAFDYLLKPADPERLRKTLQRLRRDRPPQDMSALKGASELRRIPCTGVNRITLVPLEEVESIVSRPGGVYVVCADGQERFTELTLNTLQERSGFIRCHRQHLVNPDRVREIRLIEGGVAEVRTAGGGIVPVSRRFLGPLKARLSIE